jgi:hypothetical protein
MRVLLLASVLGMAVSTAILGHAQAASSCSSKKDACMEDVGQKCEQNQTCKSNTGHLADLQQDCQRRWQKCMERGTWEDQEGFVVVVTKQ